MIDEISVLLEEYGLSNKEISVYLILVGNNRLTAYKIAKETKIHRSTVYDVLERLIAKGFISKISSESKSCYSANELSKLLSDLKDKQVLLANLNKKFKSIKSSESKTNVRVLEGMSAQKQFDYDFFNLVKDNKIREVLVVGCTPSLFLGTNLFLDDLLKKAKKLKVRVNSIWDGGFKKTSLFEKLKSFGEARILKMPSKAGFIVYSDYVAFLFTSKYPEVIEIKNKLLADEMRAYFKYLWAVAKK